MFKRLLGGSRVNDTVQKLKGNTDFLEAMCAAAALIMTVDKVTSEKEIAGALLIVSTHPTLSKAFNQRDIATTLETMLQRARAGQTGKVGLYREIDDIAENREWCETIYLLMWDVAMAAGEDDDAEGGISPSENAMMDVLAKRMRIDRKSFDAEMGLGIGA